MPPGAVRSASSFATTTSRSRRARQCGAADGLAGRRAWEIINRAPSCSCLVGTGQKGWLFRPASSDEKRRLAIARALALRRDPALRGADRLPGPRRRPSAAGAAEGGQSPDQAPIVLTTDDMSVIRAICDRLRCHGRRAHRRGRPVWESFAHPRTATRRLLHGLLPELPPFLRARICPSRRASDAILRLKFGGSSAYDPSLPICPRRMRSSVIHGAIDYIQEQPRACCSLAGDRPEHCAP